MNDNKRKRTDNDLGIDQSKLDKIHIGDNQMGFVDPEHKRFMKKFATYAVALLSPIGYSIKGKRDSYSVKLYCQVIDGSIVHKLCEHFNIDEYFFSANTSETKPTVNVNFKFLKEYIQ